MAISLPVSSLLLKADYSLLSCRFYRNMALDYNKLQISTDVFLFSSGYTDVATLSVLPRYTGGTLYYYPAFNAVRDGIRYDFIDRLRLICLNYEICGDIVSRRI